MKPTRPENIAKACTFSLPLQGFFDHTVAIETISDLMGHEDTKTTILYLGLNMDDKASAMKKMAEFQAAVKCRENEKASSWSGQSGIIAPENVWLR